MDELIKRAASANRPTRLVVVADDFGRSPAINQAVAAGFDRGILTGASIMAGGAASGEAVRLAKARPSLCVGLHATLCDGTAVLPPHRIPNLMNGDGRFEARPARAGVRYRRRRGRLLPEIELELAAQLDRASEAGLTLTHVDGHHHLHVDPVLFDLLCREASRRKIRWIRIPSGDLTDGAWVEWAIFGILGRRNPCSACRGPERSTKPTYWTCCRGLRRVGTSCSSTRTRAPSKAEPS